jgi:hypothetical protein
VEYSSKKWRRRTGFGFALPQIGGKDEESVEKSGRFHMAGLVPAIHVLVARHQRCGCPGAGYAKASPGYGARLAEA